MNRLQVAQPYNTQPQLHYATALKPEAIETKIEKSALGAIPTLRRTMSLDDKVQSGDTFGALTIIGTAAILLPEDIRDAQNGFKQIVAKIKGQKYEPTYKHELYQHHFSFLKGSFAHEYMKNVKSERGQEVVDRIYSADKSLYGTNLGKKIRKLLNIQDGKKETSEIKNIFGEKMKLSKIKAPNAFAELTGRAMKRMTVFGIGALALCEVPKLFKSMSEGDNIADQTGNTAKQVVKSGINVASIATAIGYLGALGAKKFGPAGSLFGMGIGAVAGATASNKIQELIA